MDPWRLRSGPGPLAPAYVPWIARRTEGAIDTLVFYDQDLHSYQHVPYAALMERELDEYAYQWRDIGQDMTDGSGYFAAPCPPSENYVDRIGVHYRNSNVTYFGDPEISYIDFYYGDCATPAYFVMPGEYSFEYVHLTAVAASSQSFLGVSRPQIAYEVAFDGGNNAFYSPNDDRIHFRTGSYVFWNSGTDRMIPAHEYGHAVHYRALGGFGDSGCPTPHYFDAVEGYYCAWIEGFATYHAAATYGSQIGDWYGWVADRSLYTGTSGANVENAVSSFLFDITSPSAAETWGIAYPGTYVAQIIQNCRNSRTSPDSYGRISGADDAVYCFEQNIDPTIASYFSRSQPSWSHPNATAPGNWSLNAIRSNWKWNLFKS